MSDFERTTPPPASGAAVFLQVGLGIVLVLVAHVVVGVGLLALAVAASSLGPSFGDLQEGLGLLWIAWMWGLGLAQLAYVVPLAVAAFFVRRGIALGVVIGAALTFMLQGACYGFVALVIAASGNITP